LGYVRRFNVSALDIDLHFTGESIELLDFFRSCDKNKGNSKLDHSSSGERLGLYPESLFAACLQLLPSDCDGLVLTVLAVPKQIQNGQGAIHRGVVQQNKGDGETFIFFRDQYGAFLDV
jgi:hypothetical protein